MDYYDNKNIFVCSKLFCCSFGGKGRMICVYLAGILFALGWWAFVDGLTVLSTLVDRQVGPGFEDWAPGIITTLGMLVVSMLDKETLKGDGYNDHLTLRARLFLFLGFAMMAGGMAGSVTVLVTKYIMHDYDIFNTYLGITEVVQCALIMISSAILWLSQESRGYHYI